MKQIEQFGKALVRILADLLNTNVNHELEQFEITQNELYSNLDFNVDEFVNSTDDEFLEVISEKLVENLKMYEQISDILNELGSFKNVSVQNKKLYYSKSLLLLQEITKITQTFSINLQSKIENLKVKLENLKN